MLQDTCTYMHSSLLAKDDDPLTMDSHPWLAKMIHIKLINFSAPFSMLCFDHQSERELIMSNQDTLNQTDEIFYKMMKLRIPFQSYHQRLHKKEVCHHN